MRAIIVEIIDCCKFDFYPTSSCLRKGILMKNKPYLLALHHMKKIGPRTVAYLYQRWPDLEELFRLTRQDMLQAGLPASVAAAIVACDWSLVESDLRWQEESNHFLLTWCDSDYPPLLKEISDAPPVLYAKGNLASLLQRTVAMVGTRKPSIMGRETARHFSYELARYSLTIVSGLAQGIDAEVHTGCLEDQGRTVAVMGTGIDVIYPRKHMSLAEKIVENGLLLSEFPLKTPPIAGHFPRRNRIISGLSLSILVVEAAVRSGSLITARLACEQNRDVLAIPGSIYHAQAAGCHYLLQQGAKLVMSVGDVLDELGICSDDDKALPYMLARENNNLVKCIGFEVTTIDQMIARSGLPIEKVMGDLAELELCGSVAAVPGGYVRCV